MARQRARTSRLRAGTPDHTHGRATWESVPCTGEDARSHSWPGDGRERPVYGRGRPITLVVRRRGRASRVRARTPDHTDGQATCENVPSTGGDARSHWWSGDAGEHPVYGRGRPITPGAGDLGELPVWGQSERACSLERRNAGRTSPLGGLRGVSTGQDAAGMAPPGVLLFVLFCCQRTEHEPRP